MRFLFDEHFSHIITRALDSIGYPTVHVGDVPGLGRGSTDRQIATWCGQHGHVWVTVDEDSRSRDMRLSILPAHGTKVILFSRDPKGNREALEWIVARFGEWEHEVRKAGTGYSAWLQRRNGRPRRISR